MYWKCSKDENHVWPAQVKNRTNNKNPTGCPFCSNHKVCDSNSLQAVSPEVASEWHPTSNGNLTPSDVTSGSNKRVWWKCGIKGHEWKAPISGHTSRGSRCPYCNGSTSKAELYIFHEVEFIFDDVRWRERVAQVECDIFIPKYNIAIEVDGKYWHRDKKQSDIKKNKLLTQNNINIIRVREKPLVRLNQSDILYENEATPRVVAQLLESISKIIVLSKGERLKVERYLEQPEQKNGERYRNSVCNIGAPADREHSAASSHFIMQNWDYDRNLPLIPEHFHQYSGFKVYWLCQLNPEHKWKARIAHVFKGSGCPYCKGNLADSKTCLSSTHPEVVKLWSPSNATSPDYAKASSAKKVLWVCREGHEYRRSIVSQVKGAKCPTCGSLENRFPEIAIEWHPTKNEKLTPRDIGARSTKLVWWRCKLGHEWQDSCHNRTNSRSKTQCKECRSLAYLFPKLAAQVHPKKNGDVHAKDIFANSKKSIWWLCQYCGYDWYEAIYKRTSRKNNSCPNCSRSF